MNSARTHRSGKFLVVPFVDPQGPRRFCSAARSSCVDASTAANYPRDRGRAGSPAEKYAAGSLLLRSQRQQKEMTPPRAFSRQKGLPSCRGDLGQPMRQGPTPRRPRQLSTPFGVDRATIARSGLLSPHTFRRRLPETCTRSRVPAVEILVLPLLLLQAFHRTKDPCQDWGRLFDFCRR